MSAAFSVDFSPDERVDILAAAKERREAVVLFRESLGHEREVAEADNALGNHILGEVTERTVSRWLAEVGVPYERPATPYAEAQSADPDFWIQDRTKEIDVKFRSSNGWAYFPEKQFVLRPHRIVVWCQVVRHSEYDYADYDRDVPIASRITAWSTMADVRSAFFSEKDRKYAVRPDALRPIADLLLWINSPRI